MAKGEADAAVMPVSEIVHAPGVELAGVIAYWARSGPDRLRVARS